jgi:hypothetical protein
VEMALRRMQLLHLAGERNLVLEALSRLHLPEPPEPVDLMFAAQLTAEYGCLEDAIRMGYRARRIGFKDPRIHGAYIGLILLRPPERTSFLQLDRVTTEAAFSLRAADGAERWFVLEPAAPDQRADEILPDGPVARAVMGKAVGDVVVLSESGFKRDERTIAAIKHRALHAFHQTMERFEEWFPGEPGLMKFSVKQLADGRVDVGEIKAVLSAVKDRRDEAEELYRTGKIPVVAMASALGENPIDTWFSLPSDPRTEVLCCLGTADEREQAIKLVLSRPKWIIDAVTLTWMHALGVHEEVLSAAGRVGICQSSLDLIQSLIDEKRHQSGEAETGLSIVDGELVRVETAPETIEANRTFLGSTRDWAADKLELVPALGSAVRPPIEEATEVLGRAFHDVILAAESGGCSLLSEDLIFRAVAKSMSGIDGAWLQPFMMVAAAQGRLPLDRYSEALSKMIKARRSFIAVADTDLVGAAARASFDVTPTFRVLAGSLGKPTAVVADVLKVTSSVLVRIWAQPTDLRSKRNLTFAILSGLTDQQPSRIPDVVRHVSAVANSLGSVGLQEALGDWCFGHFVACPKGVAA